MIICTLVYSLGRAYVETVLEWKADKREEVFHIFAVILGKRRFLIHLMRIKFIKDRV